MKLFSIKPLPGWLKLNHDKEVDMQKVEVAPQETMMNLIGGFWIARSIYLAASLGVADVGSAI